MSTVPIYLAFSLILYVVSFFLDAVIQEKTTLTGLACAFFALQIWGSINSLQALVLGIIGLTNPLVVAFAALQFSDSRRAIPARRIVAVIIAAMIPLTLIELRVARMQILEGCVCWLIALALIAGSELLRGLLNLQRHST